MTTVLKRLRGATGVSQDEFAQRSGVKPPTLQKHEQGKHRMTLPDARKYATALSQLTGQPASKLLLELAELESA